MREQLGVPCHDMMRENISHLTSVILMNELSTLCAIFTLSIGFCLSSPGFENVAQGCCGTGLIETAVLCGLDEPLTCQDVDKYVFFDSAHPSERVYKILADKILKSTSGVFL